MTNASNTEHVRQISWQSRLRSAAYPEQIIAILRRFRLPPLADRLNYLRQIANDDPEEPQIVLDSLRELALFLVGEHWLPDPQIGVSPDGLVHAEWVVPGDSADTRSNGVIAMEFLRSGLIRFAAISAPAARMEAERFRVSGTLSKAAALRAMQPFTAFLSSSDRHTAA